MDACEDLAWMSAALVALSFVTATTIVLLLARAMKHWTPNVFWQPSVVTGAALTTNAGSSKILPLLHGRGGSRYLGLEICNICSIVLGSRCERGLLEGD